LTYNAEDFVYECVKTGELEIDDEGRVWRLRVRHYSVQAFEAIVSPVKRRRAESDVGDYFQVRALLWGTRYSASAHRLVWRHFNGPLEEGCHVLHRDGCRKNNHPDNLYTGLVEGKSH
jgi:hypothetical protein